MVKQYLSGEMDTISFWLDFPYEVERRYEGMCREDEEYAEMLVYYLIENGTDRYDELSEDAFRILIRQQYDNVLEGVY